ncbi:thioredoxin-like protein [Gonapodya prolifera JEL478]|uniref:Thioredoxin-like protein n=1 Tax=Gonapodya prolifera (strain JEL478) TaxID=1344416 RepID=A0A139AE48_GONPJ|nr:thioredoxin-like protein [Gonapodya prolifera JEL478]|eukprot:KXS14693.1 thioredoxin-like protein [Gonapodya prolifera JEL478]
MADPSSLPKIVIYSSQVSGSRIVQTQQRTIEQWLNARKVPFEIVDVSVDQEKKVYMQSKSAKTTLPQVFANGEYAGSFDELEGANEDGNLLDFLKSKAGPSGILNSLQRKG